MNNENEIKTAVEDVYGGTGLSEVDLKRTLSRASYYLKTMNLLKRSSTGIGENLKSWLYDEVLVAQILHQPIGSLANFSIVKDITQGLRIQKILEYVHRVGIHGLGRDTFISLSGPLSNKMELLLIRMTQLKDEKARKTGTALCNPLLKDSIEEFCRKPYKLTTTDVTRKYLRRGKLWAGSKGECGLWRYLGISQETAASMGIQEEEMITHTDELFTGEALLFFVNNAMSTLEPLKGFKETVSTYQINLLFPEVMGDWAYNRFDSYTPYTIKFLAAGPGISNQIHLSEGLHGKPETFIFLTVHEELGEAALGFKEGVSDDKILAVFKDIEKNDTTTLLDILNIVSAKQGDLHPRDVMNVPGNTPHTLGCLTGLGMNSEEWKSKIINQGIVGICEIAFNQYALPGEIDPATKRISDPYVERVRKELGAKVQARHIDLNEVKKHVSELNRISVKNVITSPHTEQCINSIEIQSFQISNHYHFDLIHFKEKNKAFYLDDFGKAHSVFVCLGTTREERESIQVRFFIKNVNTSEFVLFRGEGLCIPAGFKGRCEIVALDDSAWFLKITVPESIPSPLMDTDLFVRDGMKFHVYPQSPPHAVSF